MQPLCSHPQQQPYGPSQIRQATVADTPSEQQRNQAGDGRIEAQEDTNRNKLAMACA